MQRPIELRAWLALAAAVVASALTVVTVALGLTHPASAGDFPEAELGFGVAFLGLAAAGAAATLAQPRNPVGPVLAAAALAFVVPVAAGEYAIHALPGGRGWPLGETAAWLSAWPPPLAYALLVVALPVLFPGGTLSRVWRRVLVAVAVLALTAALALAVAAGPLDGLVEIDNPYAVPVLDPVAKVVAAAAPPLISVVGLAALVDLVRRAGRSAGDERAQFRVVGLALAVLVGALAAQAVLDAGDLAAPALLQALRLVGFLAVPLALGVALTRYRLYDADRLVDRAVVYALVSAGVVVLYVTAVALLGGALGRRVDLGASVLAAGAAAVLFPLLRDGAQRLVARRLYGWRDDPYAVLSALAGRLDGLRPDRVLDDAVAALRDALRLPWVAVVDGDRVLASSGAAPALVERLDLRTQGTQVGVLEVGLRSGERVLAERDRRLLTDAATQLAGAVRAGELSRALQTSREHLVRAREEERRRLRRDLHDGLGPVLTGVVLGLDGVVALVAQDQPGAVALAHRVRGDAMSAVDEVRRVVHDLRPPALDQLGLVAALQQRAAALSTADLAITVFAEAVPELPAAVEVACYAVAVEAMNNVVRHAGATSCTVLLAADAGGVVTLEVRDDGSGRHGPPGVGTASQRERAEELGGSVDVVATPGRGTVLRLLLPLEPRR